MPWRANDYEELINRDKASLDIFWLRDESLNESDNLPYADVLAKEIAPGTIAQNPNGFGRRSKERNYRCSGQIR